MTRKQKLQHEVERIVKVLAEEYRPEKIILFGSLVRGKVYEWSDVDIVIVKQTSGRIYDRIGEVVKLCQPEVAVDFIVYTPQEFQQMLVEEPFVQEEIVNRGEILYEAA